MATASHFQANLPPFFTRPDFWQSCFHPFLRVILLYNIEQERWVTLA